MNFTQPTEEVVTNKTQAEQAKVDQLRNNATILDAEVARLKEIIQSENYTISQLGKEKAALLNETPALQTKYDALSTKITALESDVSALEARKLEIAQTIQLDEEKHAESEIEAKNKLEAISIKEKEIDAKLSDINAQYEYIAKEKEELNTKFDKLKELIS